MKKLLIVLLASVFSICSRAQDVKTFICFETQQFVAKDGNGNFKPDVPYKKHVRFVIQPFDYPKAFDASREQDLGNQLAEYMYTKHQDLLKKLRLQNAAFNYSKIEYTTNSYNYRISPCQDCKYDIEIVVLDDFKYVPNKYKGGFTETYKKAYTLVTGKEWGK